MLVNVEKQQAVRIIRMNHEPENRFNPQFMKELIAAVDQIENEQAARAIVLTSELKKYFCNGLDLNWLAQQDRSIFPEFILEYCNFVLRMFTIKKPVIAAINGHAFAGGFFLSLTADYRIMNSDRGWLCAPEIDLGFPMPPAHFDLTAYAIGKRLTEKMCLTGMKLDQRQALELGILDEIIEAEKLMDRAIEIANWLGAKNQQYYAEYKLEMRKYAIQALKNDAENYHLNYGE